MEYTSNIFVNFINRLIVFDKECKSLYGVVSYVENARNDDEKKEWSNKRYETEKFKNVFLGNNKELITTARNESEEILKKDISDKNSIFMKLQERKKLVLLIENAEASITYASNISKNQSQAGKLSYTVDELLSGKIDFKKQAYLINELFRTGKKREANNKATQFLNICNCAKTLLNEEITSLRSNIINNMDELHNTYVDISKGMYQSIEKEWNHAIERFNNFSSEFCKQHRESLKTTLNNISSSIKERERRLNILEYDFLKEFSPKEFVEEYIRIYENEQIYDNYECYNEMPKNIYISNMEYDISGFDFCEHTKKFLEINYYFMFRGSKLCIPYCAPFGKEFNYIFEFDGGERERVVKNACDLGMRLFMMLPPSKLNFTFVDPITLGESFAMFTRLVDVDDRTSEVINGKIWSSPSDIEEKLKIMTDHISNVTQRCLQGKYDNIYEYNSVAEQNAEAYQIIMLMDFPAGLTDKALKLLEQIATSGPKCGVFTIIYKNQNQYKKVPERSYPMVSNVEKNFKRMNFVNNGNKILFSSEKINGKSFLWKSIQMPEAVALDDIILKLKKGIKNAEKVVIGIEKVSDAESSETTKEGIRLPIGIHGANEVQYLTLGVGGSHHALIAGVAGSGKSSLLHTIILRSLTQYSPDELTIYLVDFKRGVEFKIYADFVLPSFKVVAIESEREFGYNILIALEREQKIRADLFKKSHVDKIEEYRELGKKMPRVLVIMDEFHELFSNANDEFAKKSAVIMERIVRQGRAFGVHLILASQSYSNITGIDRAVFDQMAVRIVLKCSKADANLLLDNGSSEIDQISIDDPGRAVYNSEAGNKEYNSHFRVAYIDPNRHRDMLQEISKSTSKFVNQEQPTRILLSNIEDNNYSIFNQFVNYNTTDYKALGRLYIGEPLSVTNNMVMEMVRSEYSNLLMIGGDTEKARSMFAFSILSLCINYWIANRKAPEIPFITLFNCKPLDDSYFKDTPKSLAELLPEYVKYVACGDLSEVQAIVSDLYKDVADGCLQDGKDKYFFVFGYQRAEELKSETKMTQSEDIDNLFNIMPSNTNYSKLAPKEMFRVIVKDGAQKGVHTVLWQDSFNALYQDDKDIISYFSMKVAFDMSPEEYSRFVSANDVNLMSENNAIYYNRARDNQKFRPYQAPDEEWLKSISEKLK